MSKISRRKRKSVLRRKGETSTTIARESVQSVDADAGVEARQRGALVGVRIAVHAREACGTRRARVPVQCIATRRAVHARPRQTFVHFYETNKSKQHVARDQNT